MNLENFISQAITTGIATLLSTSFISIFLNWKISSFQKKEDKSIEISIKLLESVFNKYDFNYYSEIYGKINKETTKKKLKNSLDEISKNLENFKKTAVKTQLSAYIYELKEDSNRIQRNIKIFEEQLEKNKDNVNIDPTLYPGRNKIIYQYDYFVVRYNDAIRRYRKAIGSKVIPEQNRQAQGYRIIIASFISLVSLTIFIILAFLVKSFFNSPLLENSLFIASVFCLFLCFVFLVGFIFEAIRYQIKTSTKIRYYLSKKNFFSRR